MTKQSAKTYHVEDIVRSICETMASAGMPINGFDVDYAVEEFFQDGRKRRILKFEAVIKQSFYRGLTRERRLSLGDELRDATRPWGSVGRCVFLKGGDIFETLRSASMDHSFSVSLRIVNDEPGRPAEQAPDKTFPEPMTHATAPLDTFLGLHRKMRASLGGTAGCRWNETAVLCELVKDPIWSTSEASILPLPETTSDGLRIHVSKASRGVKSEHVLRSKAWLAALRFASVFDWYGDESSARREWVAEHGKYGSVPGGGASFSLPSGGPAMPECSTVLGKLANRCAVTIDDFASTKGYASAAGWDIQSINTVKVLHEIAMGLLTLEQPNFENPPELFRQARRAGADLIETARWPL